MLWADMVCDAVNTSFPRTVAELRVYLVFPWGIAEGLGRGGQGQGASFWSEVTLSRYIFILQVLKRGNKYALKCRIIKWSVGKHWPNVCSAYMNRCCAVTFHREGGDKALV